MRSVIHFQQYIILRVRVRVKVLCSLVFSNRYIHNPKHVYNPNPPKSRAKIVLNVLRTPKKNHAGGSERTETPLPKTHAVDRKYVAGF